MEIHVPKSDTLNIVSCQNNDGAIVAPIPEWCKPDFDFLNIEHPITTLVRPDRFKFTSRARLDGSRLGESWKRTNSYESRSRL